LCVYVLVCSVCACVCACVFYVYLCVCVLVCSVCACVCACVCLCRSKRNWNLNDDNAESVCSMMASRIDSSVHQCSILSEYCGDGTVRSGGQRA